ncbi:hypothetical protein [Cellulosimicrobium cellulans]|uniref:hypothetical protein n=1 Tax=Cellulosimicrobium cellulans TaxID=1710 RepID=UPI00130D8C03|nr:hypothetical protein [Cellulosimicrobium cellulans]
MGDDLMIQLRRYRGVYTGLAVTLLTSGIVMVVWHSQETVLIVGSLLTLVLWCFAAAHAAYEVFRVLHAADDYLLLSTPGGARQAVLLRSRALLIWLSVLGAVEIGSWALAAGVHGSGVTVGQVLYAAGTRLVSFVAFLAVVALLALATKVVRSRTRALITGIGVATLVVIAVGMAQLALVRLAHPDYVWGLGIDTDFSGISQYATILPLIVRPPDLTATAQTMLPVTAGLNVAVVAAAALAWWALRRQRVDLA